jgi:hypothetical protein
MCNSIDIQCNVCGEVTSDSHPKGWISFVLNKMFHGRGGKYNRIHDPADTCLELTSFHDGELHKIELDNRVDFCSEECLLKMIRNPEDHE